MEVLSVELAVLELVVMVVIMLHRAWLIEAVVAEVQIISQVPLKMVVMVVRV